MAQLLKIPPLKLDSDESQDDCINEDDTVAVPVVLSTGTPNITLLADGIAHVPVLDPLLYTTPDLTLFVDGNKLEFDISTKVFFVLIYLYNKATLLLLSVKRIGPLVGLAPRSPNSISETLVTLDDPAETPAKLAIFGPAFALVTVRVPVEVLDAPTAAMPPVQVPLIVMVPVDVLVAPAA